MYPGPPGRAAGGPTGQLGGQLASWGANLGEEDSRVGCDGLHDLVVTQEAHLAGVGAGGSAAGGRAEQTVLDRKGSQYRTFWTGIGHRTDRSGQE